MPNFTVKPDGTAKFTVEDSYVTLGDGSNCAYRKSHLRLKAAGA